MLRKSFRRLPAFYLFLGVVILAYFRLCAHDVFSEALSGNQWNGKVVMGETVKRTLWGWKHQFVLQSSDGPRYQILFYNDSSGKEYFYSDRASVTGEFLALKSNANPGGFDYKAFLGRKGIRSIIKSTEDKVLLLEEGSLALLMRKCYKLEKRILQRLSTRSAAFILAIGLARKDYLSDHQKDFFKHTGSMHLLALSGLHLIILFSFLLWLLSFMIPSLKVRYPLVFVVILVYAGITGFHVSTVRSSIFIFIYMLSFFCEEKRNFWQVYFLSAAIIVLLMPTELTSPGFYMSFLALAGIYLSSRLTKGRSRMLQASLACLFAWFFTFPIQLLCFKSIALGGAIYNILLIPIFSIMLPIWYCITALSLVLDIGWGWLFLDGTVDLFFGILKIMKAAGFYHVMPAPSLFEVIAWYLMTIMAFLTWQSRKLFISAIFVLVMLVGSYYCNIRQYSFEEPDRETEVTILNCGKGDSSVVHHKGKTLLVDCGGYFGATVDFLTYKHIRVVDGLFLSHSDWDHTANAADLIEKFDVKAVYLPHRIEWKTGIKRVYEVANRKGVPIRFLTCGRRLTFGEITVSVLNPRLDSIEKDSNKRSLVLLVSKGQRDIAMFCGDIRRAQKRQVLQILRDRDIEIVKAPHHGRNMGEDLFFLTAFPSARIVLSGNTKSREKPASIEGQIHSVWQQGAFCWGE